MRKQQSQCPNRLGVRAFAVLGLLLGLAAYLHALPASATPLYNLIELPISNGGINDRGQVVGSMGGEAALWDGYRNFKHPFP